MDDKQLQQPPDKSGPTLTYDEKGNLKRSFVSAGERTHTWTTYLGVDWLFNAFTGVTFAYWANYSDLGKKYWKGFWDGTFEKALSPIVKNLELRKNSAGYGTMFMSIIAGGMFTIPPLLVLESKNVRKSLTQTYDRLIYGKEKVELDPKFEQAYQEIEHAPKKDFWNGIWSRFAALSPLLVMVLVPASKKFTNNIWFNHVEHASDWTARKLGFSERSFKNLAPAEASKRWKFIHESVAMDFGLGVPYAVLHEVFYNIFANHKARKHGSHETAVAEPITPVPITAKRVDYRHATPETEKPESKITQAVHQQMLAAPSQEQAVT